MTDEGDVFLTTFSVKGGYFGMTKPSIKILSLIMTFLLFFQKIRGSKRAQSHPVWHLRVFWSESGTDNHYHSWIPISV